MNFKSYISNRLDNLLRQEDSDYHAGTLLKRYAEVDTEDNRSKMRLKELAWKVSEQISTATDTHLESTPSAFKAELKQVYAYLVDLILVADMPLDWLFPKEDSFELEDIFDLAEGDGEDYQVTLNAYNVVESLGLAMKTLNSKPADENMLYYYLELAHYAFIRWCHKENLKPQELLAA